MEPEKVYEYFCDDKEKPPSTDVKGEPGWWSVRATLSEAKSLRSKGVHLQLVRESALRVGGNMIGQ